MGTIAMAVTAIVVSYCATALSNFEFGIFCSRLFTRIGHRFWRSHLEFALSLLLAASATTIAIVVQANGEFVA